MVYVLNHRLFGYNNYKWVTVLPTLSSEHARNTHAYHHLFLCLIVHLLFSSKERMAYNQHVPGQYDELFCYTTCCCM